MSKYFLVLVPSKLNAATIIFKLKILYEKLMSLYWNFTLAMFLLSSFQTSEVFKVHYKKTQLARNWLFDAVKLFVVLFLYPSVREHILL